MKIGEVHCRQPKAGDPIAVSTLNNYSQGSNINNRYMRFKMILAFVLIGVLASAQTEYDGRVGINTETPKATLDISRNTSVSSSSVQGVLFPRVTSVQRDAFNPADVEEGTMIYNLDRKCVEIFSNSGWDCISSVAPSLPPGVTLQIMGAGWDGVFQAGTAVAAGSGTHKVKLLINNTGATPYTQNLSSAMTITNIPGTLPGGVPAPTGTVALDGAQNSSVTVAPGTSQIISYNLKGMPQVGDIKATFRIGIYNVEQTYTVSQGTALFQDHSIFVFSWKEDSSVQGTPPIASSYQGKIDGSIYKIPVKIPYKNGDGKSFGEFTKTVSIGTAPNQKTLKLTIPAGKLHQSPSTGLYNVIGGTLEVIDGTYNAPLLEAGSADQLIATIPVQLTSAMTPFNLKVYATGGVKDKQYNHETAGVAGRYEHRFVYSKVMTYDGQIWLDKNLGAYYADANRIADFGNDQTYAKRNPVNESIDYRMLGSVFQWGRDADGHELVDWPSSLVGVVEPTKGNYFKYTNISQFPSGTVTNAWKRPENMTSYTALVSGFTDNCPSGWHTPTLTEIQAWGLKVSGNALGARSEGYRGGFTTEIGRLGGGYWKGEGDKVYSLRMGDSPYFHTTTPFSNDRFNAFTAYSYEYNPLLKIPQALDPLIYPGNHSSYTLSSDSNLYRYSAVPIRCIKD
ncbi:fibrobacter succinogenes major paralogous domain-containing protein [Bergeyella cardium]|uniref:FISUMP domain-containing protein n=1 Tax=Bergeyella cardium TaxID=1585976 RepID=UPI0013C47C86|nr:FISUMP domain-containing protein [Bergeyella cardium]